jgi:drug/metabolite transporter (DMT)-like permease
LNKDIDRNRAATAILISILCYGFMDASSKLLLRDVPAFEILFFRNLIILFCTVLLMGATGALTSIRTRQPLLQVGRSLVGNLAVLLFIVSFGSMQLSQVIAVSFLAPIFAAVWDYFLFRERTSWREWLLAVAGCGAVWLILRPGLEVPVVQALLPLCASILLGFYLSAAKWLKPSESTVTVVFYFGLIGLATSLPVLFVSWTTPDLAQLALLFLGGLCGGIGIGLRNFAYRHAPAIFVGPFEYTGIIWAGLFGYLLFSVRPDFELILGTAVIIALNLLRLFGLREDRAR